MVIHCTKPVLRALPETVEAFLELHNEWNSELVAALVAGSHFDENFLYVSVEKYCLHVQHLDLVVQLRGDCKLFESLSRTVTCTRELISIYMCYSQGDGLNTSVSRLFYLVYCTQWFSCCLVVWLSTCLCTLSLDGT